MNFGRQIINFGRLTNNISLEFIQNYLRQRSVNLKFEEYHLFVDFLIYLI